MAESSRSSHPVISEVVVNYRLENGLCFNCGTQIYSIEQDNELVPLTRPGQVKGGRCLFCYPDPADASSTTELCPSTACLFETASVVTATPTKKTAATQGDEMTTPQHPAAGSTEKRLLPPSSPLTPLDDTYKVVFAKKTKTSIETPAFRRILHQDHQPASSSSKKKQLAYSTRQQQQQQNHKTATTIRDAEGTLFTGTVIEGTPSKGKGVFTCFFDKGEFKGKTSTYKGEFADGMMEGKGYQQDAAGCIYQGEFHRGASHGYGTCRWPKGWIYQGEWVADVRHGKGTCRQTKQGGEVYKGEWKDDMWHGHGELSFAGGGEYKGEFREDKIHGKGRYVFIDGGCYEGWFKTDLREGHGEMTYADGARYVGNWHNNWREGSGSLFYPDGRVFKGTFRADEPYDGFIHTTDGILERVERGRRES